MSGADNKLAMKRVTDPPLDDEMSTGKRSRVDDGTQFLKILLPERSVGNIIGKEGSVLKRIMEESSARIRISAIDEVLPHTRERIATVSGSLDALLRAQQLISAVLSEPRQGEEPSHPPTLKLLMSNGAIGAIIGKGGAVIKEIMQLSGATLKVSQPSEAIVQTQERVLSVTGTAEAIDLAQSEICRRLSVAPPVQQIKETDYKVLKQPAAAVPAGPFMGAPYGLPWMPPHRGGLPPPPGSGPLSYKQFMSTLADDVSPEAAQRLYQDYLRSVGVDSSHVMGGGPPPGPKLAAGAPGAVTSNLPVADKTVSGLIGKGGTVIKDIINRSGAEVKFSQKDPNNVGADRIVTITGSAESVAIAQRLITDRTRELEQQRAGGPPSAPAPASAFPPPPFGYDAQASLGYMHGMPGYGAAQYNAVPGFGTAAQQPPYGYTGPPPASGSTPWL